MEVKSLISPRTQYEVSIFGIIYAITSVNDAKKFCKIEPKFKSYEEILE